MSQAGISDLSNAEPTIPLLFVTDSGNAVAAANVLNVLGLGGASTAGAGNTITVTATSGVTDINVDAHTAPGTDPVVPDGFSAITITGGQATAGTITNTIQTNSLAANTLTIEIQKSSATGATNATLNGVAHFDSAAFDVDANGFVQLNGGGIAATSFDVQANTAPGTDPVVPTATGSVVVNGAAVANHSVVLETRSRAANAYNLEIQYATSAAATDATKSGVAHFDSADFTVDADGFVTFTGSSGASTLIGVNSATPPGTNPVVPDGFDTITFDTARVAAGALLTALQFNSTAANTATLQFQTSLNAIASDPTVNGVCHFSTDFNVDGDGYVTFPYGSPLTNIAVETNTAPGTNPVLPNTGSIQFVGTLVAAGAGQALKTTSIFGSQVDLEIQTTSAQIATSSIANGVCHFDDAFFSVDADGFVSFIGSGSGIDSIGVQTTSGTGTDPVLPNAGVVDFSGALVVAGTVPVNVSSPSANNAQIEVQTSQAIAAADSTKVGLCNFDSASFGVDADGFVTSLVGGFTWTDVTTSTQSIAVENGYVTDRGANVTYTLPATATLGQEFIIVGKLGLTTITPNANQQLLMGSSSGTVGVTGTLVATNVGDCVTFVCITAGASTVWRASSWVGSWTLT